MRGFGASRGVRVGPVVLAPALAAMLALGAVGCSEDELPQTASRGVPGGAKKGGGETKEGKAAAKPTRRTTPTTPAPAGEAPLGEAGAPEVDPGPKRPPPVLDATSFVRRRDPFQGLVEAEPVQPEPDPIRAERAVLLRQYSFEDLKLVAIANSRRSGVQPRALFVAGDGYSDAVRQGEYFSSAEVLLVAVNRDYVEIEVVDEELAASLGMQRGERRALYLRNE
jgi:Tfp pilus assembly protein PilP